MDIRLKCVLVRGKSSEYRKALLTDDKVLEPGTEIRLTANFRALDLKS